MNQIQQPYPRNPGEAALREGAEAAAPAPLVRLSRAADTYSTSLGRALEEAGALALRAGASMRHAGRYMQQSCVADMRVDLADVVRARPGLVFTLGLGAGALAYRMVGRGKGKS